MSRRINAANPTDDGSSGRFVRGLPTDVAGPPDAPIEYDSQAGCPRDVAGGTHVPNVNGAPPTGPAPAPKPFTLSK